MLGIEDGRVLVLPPPPIQGIGNAAGFTMQIELRDGSFDLAKLQGSVNAVVKAAETQSGIQRISAPFRATVPQYRVEIDREKVQSAAASPPTRYSPRWPAISAPAMSTSSTSSAASSRSMCRATRNSACRRRRSAR